MINETTRRRNVLRAVGTAGVALVAGCLASPQASHPPNQQPAESIELSDPRPVDVDRIAADPANIPGPIDRDEPAELEWHLETIEAVAEIEPGVTHHFMTFDGQVPGPLLRARVGDTVTLTFDVPDEFNADIHNVDFHAVYGPGGGAVDTTIAPGEGPVEIQFKLMYPGAHIYHCAPGQHDYHISTGMFGTILVEPEGGLPAVDREYYLGQHELYTNGSAGQRGHHRFSFEAAKNEDPTYVLFNGEVGALTDDGYGAMEANVGETVRIYWCNGGPNLVSGPHPIGNVWSKWHQYGDLLSQPAQYIEGASLPAGVTGVGEMEMWVPGPIVLVDHALSRVVHKGFGAVINVDGDADPTIYNGSP